MVRRTVAKFSVSDRSQPVTTIYIKATQVTFKSRDGVLETQEYPAIDNKALSAKSRAREIRLPTDKAYRARNRVDKDKALGAKKPTTLNKIPHG